VIDDEIPKSVAKLFGHVCGVCAVGMAAASAYGAWAVAHKFTVPGLVFVATGVAIAALLFRWAGALAGYWDTTGRLSVPKAVYVVLGALFAAMTLLGAYVLIVAMPRSFADAFMVWIGVLGGGVLTYLSALAVQRFK
jgi:hypothetical protein